MHLSWISTERVSPYFYWKMEEHLDDPYKFKYFDQMSSNKKLWSNFITVEITGNRHFRFEPAPVQVLLSEEISGSLRKLKVRGHFPLTFHTFQC